MSVWRKDKEDESRLHGWKIKKLKLRSVWRENKEVKAEKCMDRK